jgi:hypothetical protein
MHVPLCRRISIRKHHSSKGTGTSIKIWQTQSQGRFGFSAQAQKWKSLFGNKFEPTNEHFEDFATDLGWRYRGRYLSNNQLKYSLDAPKGYLPRAFLDGPVWGNFIAYFDGCKIK